MQDGQSPIARSIAARLFRQTQMVRAERYPRSTRSLLAIVLIAIATMSAGRAIAQADNALERARQFMASKNAESAYALLAPLEPARAGQPEFDYLLGIAALDSGRISQAIFALERVLAVQPDNALARAEIGRAYLAAGETETARAELTQVRSGPIPATAVPAVDRLLGAISQLQSQQTTQWRAYLDAGFGYDTNVNSATADSQIAVPAFAGLVFSLDPANRRAHDAFALLGGGTSVRVPIAPDLAFAGNLAASQTFNRDQDRFETGLLDANAGLAKTLGANVLSAVVQANSNWFGGSRFRDAYGVLGQWQYALDARAQTTVFAQATRLDYPGNTIRDANRWVLGAGYARALAGGPAIFGSAYAGREEVRADGVPHLGHRLAGVRAGLQWDAMGDLAVFGSLSFEDRRYGGDEPFFDRVRQDRQSGVIAGVHYMVAPAWRLTPQVAYTDNHSNITIYEFRRVVASLTLRREF